MNKEMLKNLVHLAAAAIVIGGLVIGKFQEKQEVVKQPEEKVEQEEKTDPALSKEPEMTSSEEEKKEDEHDHDHDSSMDGVGEFDLSKLDESEKNYTINRPTLSKFYRPEEIAATKEVGEQFVRSFHVFNGENPTKHIEESKPYVVDELYKKMTGEKGAIIRPTKVFFERTVIAVEMREPRNVSSEFITWEARVTGEIKDENGNKVEDDLTVYTLKFKSIDGNYKVLDYVTNAAW